MRVLYLLYHSFGSALDNWTRGDGSCCPGVFHNNTSTTQSYASGVVQPADMLNLHPGFSGERSVLRWTAPAAGSYLIEGKFQGLDTRGNTSDATITHNGASVFSANINSYGAQALFSLTRTLAAGDMIEFTVGWGSNSDYSFDSTGLAASITLVDTHNPTNEFSSTQNPSNGWTYGYRNTSGSFTAYPSL